MALEYRAAQIPETKSQRPKISQLQTTYPSAVTRKFAEISGETEEEKKNGKEEGVSRVR